MRQGEGKETGSFAPGLQPGGGGAFAQCPGAFPKASGVVDDHVCRRAAGERGLSSQGGGHYQLADANPHYSEQGGQGSLYHFVVQIIDRAADFGHNSRAILI